MPIYEYQCTKCNKLIEELYKINKAPETIQCDCGDLAKRIISECTFKLKGDNWAKDSYGLKRST